MKPMSLEDFRGLKEGQEVWLSYCLGGNSGRFLWRHKAVMDDRVVGQFQYSDASGWSKVGDYLYESQCRGTRCVCRGSGADPVHRCEEREDTVGIDYTTPLEDVVTGPGKFEGEPGYTFYFYENMGDGLYHTDVTDFMGEECETSYTAFDITDADTAIFPELKGYKRAFLHEDDNGFVTCTLSETGTL